MKTLAIAIAVLSVSLGSSVSARDWDDNAWVRQTIRQERRETYRRTHPYRPPVYSYQRRHYSPPAPVHVEHRHEYRDDPAGHRKCRVEFQAAGDQALTEDGAKQAALKAFQQEIRFAHGELWADPDHAQDKSFLCVKSSVGAGLFHRCRVRARPCIPEGTAQ